MMYRTIAIALSVMGLGISAFAEMGSTQDSHYRVLPVPRGQLQSTDRHRLVGDAVKDKDGKNIGTLENLIIDEGTGRIEAAVIGYRTANGTIALTPVSWRDVQVDKKSGEIGLRLGERDIVPSTISRDTKDMSPDVLALVKDMQQQIQSEEKNRTR
jgi:sporulation protein YlmC with PRC-barrel domain